MFTIKISDMLNSAPLSGGELVVMNQHDSTVTSSLSAIKAYVGNTYIVTLSSAINTLTPDTKLSYIRFTNNSPKTLIIPIIGSLIPIGDVVTLRNAGTGNLTLSAESLAIGLNFATGGDVLASKTTAQMIYLGSDIWDIL